MKAASRERRAGESYPGREFELLNRDANPPQRHLRRLHASWSLFLRDNKAELLRDDRVGRLGRNDLVQFISRSQHDMKEFMQGTLLFRPEVLNIRIHAAKVQ